jgi:hypothetical protein
MIAESYTTRAGKAQFRPVLTVAEMSHIQMNSGAGFCLACGEEQDGCEPDARQYECDLCGERKVYGIEELLMMGLVKLSDDTPEPLGYVISAEAIIAAAEPEAA